MPVVAATPNPTTIPTPTAVATPLPTPTTSPSDDPSSPDDPPAITAAGAQTLLAGAYPSPPPGSNLGPPTGVGGFTVPGGSDSAADLELPTIAFGGVGGLLVWAVPSLVISVPGVLLLLVIGAQAVGGLAWLPFARRKIGTFGVGPGRDRLGRR
jgi:hypothetical protein